MPVTRKTLRNVGYQVIQVPEHDKSGEDMRHPELCKVYCCDKFICKCKDRNEGWREANKHYTEYKRLAKIPPKKSTVKKLEIKTVFKSHDLVGDIAGELMFVADGPREMFGCDHYHIIFDNGDTQWMSLAELNVDESSIRPYNPDTDCDYYFYLG